MKMKRLKKFILLFLVFIITSSNIIQPLTVIKAADRKDDNEKNALDYVVFSGSESTDFNLHLSSSNIEGDVYTGKSFNFGGSQLFLEGDIDAKESININAAVAEVNQRNSGVPSIAMPDLDKVIHEKAGAYVSYEGDKEFRQDNIILKDSIKVENNVSFKGSSFEGNGYVIAGGNIEYNISSLNHNNDNRVVFYSESGDIIINGSDVTINGIVYAPNGKVKFSGSKLTINGRIIADSIEFNGSQLSVYGSPEDLDLVTGQAISKTYTVDGDFLEGELEGTSLSTPDQLMLDEKTEFEDLAVEKIYGNIEDSKGVKISSLIDKSLLNPQGDQVNLAYSLSGFDEVIDDTNGIDLVIVVDESGSMSGARMKNSKDAAHAVIAKMNPNDRSAVVGFNSRARKVQDLTVDELLLKDAVNNLRAGGGTSIYTGIKEGLSILESQSDDTRQQYIILLSDGEDSQSAQSIAQATLAGERGIPIFAMMVGNGTLQMQNIAIYSKGIYKNSPSAEDIIEIMSYFASEVFDTAGRNTTFKLKVKDKDMIDLTAILPEPSSIEENTDGSVDLEWFFDRIAIKNIEQIQLPFTYRGPSDKEVNFVDLVEDVSLLYNDRQGLPTAIYPDDITVPLGKYVDNGKWSALYDSGVDGTEWGSVY